MKKNCLLLSSFNISTCEAYFANDAFDPDVKVLSADFGQAVPTLLDASSSLWKESCDAAIVWTRPEDISSAFERRMSFEPATDEALIAEVDAYLGAIKQALPRAKAFFIPTWCMPGFDRGVGALELKSAMGIRRSLALMNQRLVEGLGSEAKVFLFDSQRWVEMGGKNAFSPKLWYLSKNPFGPEVYKEAARDFKAALNALSGKSKKLIVVDLDDTLWGGIVGDLGWKELKIGGHDHVGEAYADFQKALKALNRRGILLGVVSKNDEKNALEAIRMHPEMLLKENDFAGWKINWNDKAQNIVDLAAELDLGLQSIVFIDDNPVERARVREALPEVLVLEWPADPMLYRSALTSLSCFDVPAITQEDTARAKTYAAKRESEKSRESVQSLEEWLNTLGIQVKIEALNENNLQRAAQLLNKTNQMNLSTRRLSEEDFLGWSQQEGNKVWTFRVSDRFIDSGLTGIVSLESDGKKTKIVDFILSCRVMGRKVEEGMLYWSINHCSRSNASSLSAVFIPTEKNQRCFEFFKKSGLEHEEATRTFHWNVKKPYAKPPCIELITEESRNS